jgi:hypothetical protein
VDDSPRAVRVRCGPHEIHWRTGPRRSASLAALATALAFGTTAAVPTSAHATSDAGTWAITNTGPTNNTSDNTFADKWHNSGKTNVATGAPHNNVLTGDVQGSGHNGPSGAVAVIGQAGIQNAQGRCVDINGGSIASGIPPSRPAPFHPTARAVPLRK